MEFQGSEKVLYFGGSEGDSNSNGFRGVAASGAFRDICILWGFRKSQENSLFLSDLVEASWDFRGFSEAFQWGF